MASALNRHYPEIQGELEDELEDEFEQHEHRSVQGPPGPASGEFEDELEDEFEDEFDAEDEEFLGGITRAIGSLLGSGADTEDEWEDEDEFDFEAEAEGEQEDEFDAEGFVNPVRRVYPDAELMAHLSTQAASARTDAEAEAFLGALVPLVARLVPRATQVVLRHAPSLLRSTSRIGRQLRRHPASRGYMLAIPVILQRTAQALADQEAAGRTVTPDLVITTLTQIATRVLREAPARTRAMRAVGVFDQRYRRRWQRRPAGRSPQQRRRRGAPPGRRRR